MEIIVAVLDLDHPGGVQSYVLTVAPHLERLGHHVTIYAEHVGLVADEARSRGLRVTHLEHQLPASCDAVLANDAASALVMAELYPNAVRGFVMHGADLDLVLPPPHPAVAHFVVALNGVAERRARAVALAPPVTRLRQPIDIAHFYPASPLRPQPQEVLLLGNYLRGKQRDALTQACEDHGLRWRQIGAAGELQVDPLPALLQSDVVIAQGRSALEAMACGRAVWLFGPGGGDGWVTPDNYPALEDDGLRGRATEAVMTGPAIGTALPDYAPELGELGRQLVVMHHSPYDHAVSLVGLLQGAGGPAPEPAPLREMARLVRTQYDAQARVGVLATELRELHFQHQHLRAELIAALDQARELETELALSVGRWEGLTATRRWRAASLAAKPLDRVRQRRGRA